MRCVRIWFEKKGMSRYISHLDLMRTMTRAIRRSKIPLWYTEGFNPHPYMTFSLPLSLGTESVCESMDIRIEGEIGDGEILKALKDAMPDGIDITKVTEPVFDPKEIAYGEFELRFSGDFDIENALERVNGLLSGEQIIVRKLGKKGRKKELKEINLKEHIVRSGCAACDDGFVLSVVLPAGCKTNINPSLLADEVMKLLSGDARCLITRKRLLTAEMKEFK